MKKAGIVMGNYKAPTFRKNLKAGGFEWVECGQLTKKTIVFTVEFEPADFHKLSKIIKASNDVSRQRN